MSRALEPLFSFLDEGREAEAAEYLASYAGGATRRGVGRVMVPPDRLSVRLRCRLEDLGCTVQSGIVDGKPVLHICVVERPVAQPATPP